MNRTELIMYLGIEYNITDNEAIENVLELAKIFKINHEYFNNIFSSGNLTNIKRTIQSIIFFVKDNSYSVFPDLSPEHKENNSKILNTLGFSSETIRAIRNSEYASALANSPVSPTPREGYIQNFIRLLNLSGFSRSTSDWDMYYSGTIIRYKENDQFQPYKVLKFHMCETENSGNIEVRLISNTREKKAFLFKLDEERIIINPDLDFKLPDCGYKNIDNYTFYLTKNINLGDRRKKSFYHYNYIYNDTIVNSISIISNKKVNTKRKLETSYDTLWQSYPVYSESINSILNKNSLAVAMSNHLAIYCDMLNNKISLYRDTVPIGYYIFSKKLFKVNPVTNLKQLESLNIPYEC